MTSKYRPRARRGGFTLIELLLVIAIIAILLSMLAVGGNKAIGAARRTAQRQEISQLEAAVTNFTTSYGVPYLPSIIWIDESGTYSTPPANLASFNVPGTMQAAFLTQLATDSKQYLERMFGRSIYISGTTNLRPINWNNDSSATDNFILEGEQCLYFFLGAEFTGLPNVKGPFFEFDRDRLEYIPGNPFPAYRDRYGKKVYAYFSVGKNGYNQYANFGVASHCPTLRAYLPTEYPPAPPSGPLMPYTDGSRYWKPNAFQIISAGADGLFGKPAAGWTPASAGNVYAGNRHPGIDDMSNFYDQTLGSSQ